MKNEMAFTGKMDEQPDDLLEELLITTMLEFIINDPFLIARYKKLFEERINSYNLNELDTYAYVRQITLLAEEKLQ